MSDTDHKSAIASALDSNLRLHAKSVDLGQAEMLTDALLHRFDDLEQRLNTYIVGSAGGDKLRKNMQAYLSRLNSNTLIPLHFRLKVLNRFEEQLDLFDAEMTAAILNAHKIGIDMVQKEAQEEPSYYPVLVNMVSHAIELAGRLMRDILGSYQVPAVITIRQVFDLMRLGLVILPELAAESEDERKRFYTSIVRYEVLRNLDFFSKTKEQQLMMMDELEHHVDKLKPHYLAKGATRSLEMKGFSLLVTNLSRPHDTGQVMPFPPQTVATDYLIVPMDDFIDKLVLSIDRAEKVLKNPVLQSKDIQIEKSLATTVVGGNAMLDALRTKSRDSERQEYGNAKLSVGWTLLKSMADSEEKDEVSGELISGEEDLSLLAGKGAWTVMNISKQGQAIERLSDDDLPLGVGSLVGLHWLPHRGEPQFGFIRWIKFPKLGEQQLGLEFYLQEYVSVPAVMLSVGDTKKNRTWSVLATFEQDGEHTLIFPDITIFKGMVISIVDDKRGGYFKVATVQKVGPNYSICTVRVAAELDTSNIEDIPSMVSSADSQSLSI